MKHFLMWAVYTMTPKGNFSLKYEGASLEEAEKAYKKLAGKPRQITRREGLLSTSYKKDGGFPE